MIVRWTAPENDYRNLPPAAGGEAPSMSVVIPAHQSPSNMARTRAGLVAQDWTGQLDVASRAGIE